MIFNGNVLIILSFYSPAWFSNSVKVTVEAAPDSEDK